MSDEQNPRTMPSGKKPKVRRIKQRGEKGHGTVQFNGYTWYYRIPNPAAPKGVEKQAGFDSEARARLALSMRYVELQNSKVGIQLVREQPRIEELTDLFLKPRERTGGYRAAKSRWTSYVLRHFGKLRVNELTGDVLHDFIDRELEDGFNASLNHVIRMIGTLYNDSRVRKMVPLNPVRELDKSIRKRIASRYDPKKTPFLKDQSDCVRVFHHMPEEASAAAYAIGAFTGFRTGEIIGLWCEDFLLDQKLIHLQRQVKDGRLGPLEPRETDLKDAVGNDRSRMVPINNKLMPIVREYILKMGGKGLLFPPLRPNSGGRPDLGREPEYMRASTLNAHLKKTLVKLGLPEMTWYEATKHTFASHYAMETGNLRKLAELLGHSTTYVTERYAHLSPENYTDKDRAVFAELDMRKKPGKVVAFGRKKFLAQQGSETPPSEGP